MSRPPPNPGWAGHELARELAVGVTRAEAIAGHGVERREGPAVKIWVDADAMPVAVKTLMFRAAERKRVQLTLVANCPLRHPESNYLHSVVVQGGFNVADDWIVENAEAGDLVVTADIPLAARVVSKGAVAVDPRGTRYTEENIGAKLATRNLMEELRGASMLSGGGPAPYGKKDLQKFASAFNTLVVRLKAEAPRPADLTLPPSPT